MVKRLTHAVAAVLAGTVAAVPVLLTGAAADAATPALALIRSVGCTVAAVQPDPALTGVSLAFTDGSTQTFVGPSRLQNALYAGTATAGHLGATLAAVTVTSSDGTTATAPGRTDCGTAALTSGPVTTTAVGSDGTVVNATWTPGQVTVTTALPAIGSVQTARTLGQDFQAFAPILASTYTAVIPGGQDPLAVTVGLVPGGSVLLGSPLAVANPALPGDSGGPALYTVSASCTSLGLKRATVPVSRVEARWALDLVLDPATATPTVATLDLTPPATSTASTLTAPAGRHLDAYRVSLDGQPTPPTFTVSGLTCSAAPPPPPLPPALPPAPAPPVVPAVPVLVPAPAPPVVPVIVPVSPAAPAPTAAPLTPAPTAEVAAPTAAAPATPATPIADTPVAVPTPSTAPSTAATPTALPVPEGGAAPTATATATTRPAPTANAPTPTGTPTADGPGSSTPASGTPRVLVQAGNGGAASRPVLPAALVGLTTTGLAALALGRRTRPSAR